MNNRELEQLGRFSIPVWSLSALINDDDSGLNDDDEQVLNEWLNDITHESLCFRLVDDSNGDFNPAPEFGLPCNTVEIDISGYAKSYYKEGEL